MLSSAALCVLAMGYVIRGVGNFGMVNICWIKLQLKGG